ncbi:MAG: MBL fold metallo-hydrolase [Actinomycetota bacterium]|nr:MBL fold metallo-hydrolase [Actinomycetota bacterium]
MSGQETPRPPATAEFGHVTPDGPAHHYPDTGVAKLSVGAYDNNVYVIARDGQGIIVDGAADPERILKEVAGLAVAGIVQTHNHFDHVQALADLVAALNVPVYAHRLDAPPVGFEPLDEGSVTIGSITLRVLHTPGHTPGSLCYLIDEFLFSGDTLFPGGPGNTDGDPSRFANVMASLDRLFVLPDATRVLPGHGLDTTIGRERPYVETWRTRGW